MTEYNTPVIPDYNTPVIPDKRSAIRNPFSSVGATGFAGRECVAWQFLWEGAASLLAMLFCGSNRLRRSRLAYAGNISIMIAPHLHVLSAIYRPSWT